MPVPPSHRRAVDRAQAWLEAGPVAEADSPEGRIVDAAVICLARWGVAKTGLDDVAREAGTSRATVYRLFPGGKDALLDAVARTEVRCGLDAVGAQMAAADDLHGCLVAGLHDAGQRLSHHGALRFLFTFEPELILPLLSFDAADTVLGLAAHHVAPHLARFVDAAAALRLAELCVRIVISYVSWPCLDVDITDLASVERLVDRFVLPAAFVAAA